MKSRAHTAPIVVMAFMLFTVFCLAPIGAESRAEDWNPNNIEIILPHKVGSNQDMVTRILGEAWSKRLGIPFIYTNKDGASGQIGYTYFRTRPKDGRALLSTNLASAVIMYKEQNLPFVWEEEFIWLGIFGIDPGTFFVPKDSPFTSMKQVIEEAKKRKITVAISYWASPDNLLLQQIMQQTGAQFEIIPYGSGNDLVTQVLGGHIDLGFTKVSGVEKAGDTLRHLALSMDRNPIPDMTNNAPILDEELGTNTLVVASFRSVNVPRELYEKYPERFDRIREAFEEAKDDPAVIEGMRRAGVDPLLIVDWTTEQLEEQTKIYWDAFDAFKDIYMQKQ